MKAEPAVRPGGVDAGATGMTEELPGGVAEIVEALFDREGYRRRYPDVQMLAMDPLEHFLRIGRHLGRDPGFDIDSLLEGQYVQTGQVPFRSFGIIEHDPLISILIVSYNSGRDLETLFHSIAAQTYAHYEVVLVENGEEDTEPLFRRFFPGGHFLRADNVGFAEGNNLALARSRGELVALVNPDTRLAPDMLQMLLEGLRFDTSAAVAVPRIWFFERFVHLRIRADVPFSIDREQLLHGLGYRKLFLRTGADEGKVLRSDEEGLLEVEVPYEQPRRIEIVLHGTKPVTFCETRIDFAPTQRTMQGAVSAFSVEIAFDAANCTNARYLVNNAGSMFRPDGTPFDRGFAQYEDGRFLGKSYVDALCGCAALIRRAAILDRTLFCGPSFAYYEDTELSRWLTRRGYRILYQPMAQVFHRHSESTNEHSLSWRVLVDRGRQIYELVTQTPDTDTSGFSIDYPDAFAGGLRAKLEAFDESFRQSGSPRALLAPRRRTACVYNSYFSSMGGGEKHALDIAGLLRADFDVYLASEKEFDIGEMEAYFGIDLSGMRKIVCGEIDRHFTSKFDLFVNSTFRSDLLAAAKDNIYVVSFPQRSISPQVARRYRFLHNSPFTRRWAETYWGQHAMATVLPILGEYPVSAPAPASGGSRAEAGPAKEKLLLSVGRFTYGGHCKNHHLVVAAFRELVAEGRISSDWRLEIIGSCDLSRRDAVEYHRDLLSAAQGYNVAIRANADRAVLDDAYARCAVYVHAAGLGTPADRPELHEHFGISTFEALAAGCIPVVYALGGPAEQIAGLPVGGTFANTQELKQVIVAAAAVHEGAHEAGHDAAHERRDALSRHAAGMVGRNVEAFQDVLNSILTDAATGTGLPAASATEG